MRFLALVVSAALAVLMAALIALVTIQVVLRYFFDIPLQWALEVSRIMFLWIVFLGAAIAIRRDQYSSLDMVSRALPSWWKGRVVMAVVVAFAVLLAAVGAEYARNDPGDRFVMTGLPVLVMFVAPAVSGILMVLFGLERLLAHGKPETREAAGRGAENG